MSGIAAAAPRQDPDNGPGIVIAQAIAQRPLVLVAVMCVALVFAMAGFSAYWSLQPVLQPAWQMSNVTVGWLSGAFFGGYVLGSLPDSSFRR